MTMCGKEEIEQLVAAMQTGAGDEMALMERLLAAYPDDPRLHFLRGSVLAGSNRPIEAHAALARSVELAPDFAIARFQLGFFELTSGEPARALATWEPLDGLPDDHYLHHFVTGLRHLIHDRFPAAIAALRTGIAANTENPPLNRDMQLLIERSAELTETADTGDAGETSATSFFLDQFGTRGTTH
jgi:Flp pilus assembly protein TadD